MRDGSFGLWCAVALFAGCLLALGRPVSVAHDLQVDVALACACCGFVLTWVLRRRTRVGTVLVVVSVGMLGWAHGGHALQREACRSLVDRVDDQPELTRFEAQLLEAFSPPDAADTDLLDRFQPDADDPPWRARAELRSLDGRSGRRLVDGVVTLIAPQGAASLRTGDVVAGVGWLSGVQAPRNPGERDLRESAWKRGVVGRLKMDVAPMCVEPAPWWLCARTVARRWVDRNLLAALQPHASQDVQTLVVAMTTGRCLQGYASLRAEFAHTGLSHFLAISGFNVAVLFATCGVLMETTRVPGAWRGPLLTLTGALFLILVDVEVSVLRAGMAGMLAGASLALGRGWRADGVLGVAAMVTLAIDPWAAANPGFQLSYAAVLALRHGSGPVDEAMRHGLRVMRIPETLVNASPSRAVRLALAASVAAWMVSTPITLACLGNASPWCAVASTLLGPLAAAITVLASIATVLGGVPAVGWSLGAPLAWMAQLFLWLVRWVGTWPGCTVRVEPMPGLVAVACLALLFAAWIGVRRRWTRAACLTGAVTIASVWVASPHPSVPGAGPYREPSTFTWTALAIGDGSVHLIECGADAVLFDAGSISRPGVGSAVVVPALRALGVTRLQAIIVSHPHLDHFAAVPEVVEAIPTGRVVVTEAWRGAESRPGAPGVLLTWLRSHAIPVEHATEGWTFGQGLVTWRALHPPAGFRATAVNDGSLGFLLSHEAIPDRPLALLLGDAQDAAIARHLARRDVLRPWVMELPHHGGWRPLAMTLCEWVHPSFVMQSTGQRRFSRDRLSAPLAEAVRGVTCRDGALRFSLIPAHPTPRASLERWTAGGWRPLAP